MNGGDPHQPPPPLPPPPRPVCEDCKSDDRLILHHIVKVPKSQPLKLCTSCVIKHYHKSCCTECFELYDANSLSAPPVSTATTTVNNRLLVCLKCQSWSHVSCPKATTPKSPYLCPSCRPGNFKYFDVKKPRKENSNGVHVFEKVDAKKLYAAARISVITMTKAATAARLEAERRVKEAALAKKRAKEAIDHVFAVAAKVEAKQREVASTSAAAVVSAGPKSATYAPVRLEKNGSGSDMMNGVVNGNGAVVTVPTPVAVVKPQQKNTNNGGAGSGSGGKDGGSIVAQQQSK